MKKIIQIILLTIAIPTFAQQVGIGTNSPDSTAVLDIQSTNSGILIPRMTTAQRTAILGVAKGLLVFDITTNSFWFHNGTSWDNLSTTKNTLNQAYNEGGAGLGRKITANDSAVIINGEDGLYVTGTYNSGTDVEIEGTGTRMFFNPKKAAFRAGYVFGNKWDNDSIGDYSFASGYNAKAKDISSIAMGFQTNALGPASIAIGTYLTSSGNGSTAMGAYTNSSANGSTALGYYTTASGDGSIAMGYNTNASGEGSTAIGQNTIASSLSSTAMGSNTTASGFASTTMGYNTTASGFASTSMGYNTTASSSYSTAMGLDIQSNGFASTVLGVYNDTIVASQTAINDSTPLFIVGNGDNSSTRSNAMVVRKDGKIGMGTNTPTENLELSGAIKVGNTTNTNTGAIRWSGTDFEGYDGTEWVSLTLGGYFSWGNSKPPNVEMKQGVEASDGSSNDYFGYSVSINGDYAIIGAYKDTIGGNATQGSAYIFKKTGVSWAQEAKITASDGAAGDFFGQSVSINGDYAIIGASLDDIGVNTNQGSAYIFKRTGTSWAQEAKITASDGYSNDYFGYSVSINGVYAIIGAYGDNIGGNAYQGSAYIFKRAGVSWAQKAKITASDGAAYDYFGLSVSINGDYAIIGAYKDNIGGNGNQGSAYIFKRTGVSWAQEAKITAPDGAAGDFFGYSVSINGDFAIIGAYGDDIGGNGNQGSAYIFKRTGVSWAQEAKITAPDGAAGDKFGYSVSINGDYAIIGAYLNDIGGNTDQGSAYIVKRIGVSWVQEAKITAPDGVAGDIFGYSVSIDGDNILVGAPNASSNKGKAYFSSK